MKLITKILLIVSIFLSSSVIANDITFGASISLSGKYSTSGKHVKRGYDLAIDKINTSGGVDINGKNYQLKVIYYDDKSDIEEAKLLTKKLILEDKVDFILGPYGSTITEALAEIVEKYKIPMIEANGASTQIFNKGYKYTFAVLSTADNYLKEAVKQIAKNSNKKDSDIKVAILVGDDIFPQEIRHGIIKDAKHKMMQIIIDDTITSDKDISESLIKVKKQKPDLLVFSDYAKGAKILIEKMHELEVKVDMLAMTHCESANIHNKELFENMADYTLCASQWSPAMKSKGKLFSSAKDYSKEFVSQYNYVPPYQAAESSAAIIVFVDAIKRASSLDKELVREAIAKTDLATFYGDIKFSKKGNNIAKPMILLQIINGRYFVVAPSYLAEKKLVYPRR